MVNLFTVIITVVIFVFTLLVTLVLLVRLSEGVAKTSKMMWAIFTHTLKSLFGRR